MRKFVNSIEKIKNQTKLTARQLSFALFGIVLFVSILIAIPFMSTQTISADAYRGKLNNTPTPTPTKAQFSFLDGPTDLAYQQNFDALASYNVKWIRFGIASWDVVNGCSTSSINWNDAGFTKYDAVINYALSKGMKIDLITADSNGCASTFSQSNYNNFISRYATHIAQRYKGKVAMWQMYNEADGQDFQNQSQVKTPIPSKYLTRLNAALGSAKTAIHAVDPNIKLTTTSLGYPLNATQEQTWNRYFDGISSNLDVISLDLYPLTDQATINMMGTYVSHAHTRYNKPVSVGEFGINTCTGCVTSDVQGQMLTSSIASLKNAIGLTVAFIYEYKDAGSDQSNGEDTFGIVDYNNNPKSDYNAVMTAIQQANSEN